MAQVISDRVLHRRSQRFWAWFIEHELELFEGSAGTLTNLRAHLRKVQGNLGAEVMDLPNGQRRIVITANGVREALPAAAMLDQVAPPLRLFDLQTFRSPAVALSPVTCKDVTVRPHQVEFILEPDGLRKGLTLFVEGYDHKQRDRALSYKAACLRLLDMALGEVRVAREIGFIDFREFHELGMHPRIPLWRLATEMGE